MLMDGLMIALLMLFHGDLLLKKSFYLSYCNKTDQEPTSKELSFSVVVDVGGAQLLRHVLAHLDVVLQAKLESFQGLLAGDVQIDSLETNVLFLESSLALLITYLVFLSSVRHLHKQMVQLDISLIETKSFSSSEFWVQI